MKLDVDVLVIGAGACGLTAAIAAHDCGVSVAIVEKRERPGGNSSLSTGSVPAANSRFQRGAGLVNSPEKMVADLMGMSKETDDLALVQRMAEVSAETVEWLVDTVGAQIVLITAYKHIGHSIQRLHAPVSRRGQDLVNDFLVAIEKREIPLAVGNAVEDLIVENGVVLGARVDAGAGTFEIRARKTILAVNGFAADPALVKQYCPEIAGRAAPLVSHGEAVRWGLKIGAALANMGAYQGYAAVAYPHGSLLSWTTDTEKGGILVGADAKRFGDESLGYSGFARVVLEQGEYATAVFDQKIFEVAAQEEEFMELVHYGGVKKVDDVAALAAMFDLDGAELVRQVEAFNRSVRGGAERRVRARQFWSRPARGRCLRLSCRARPLPYAGWSARRRQCPFLSPDGTSIPGLFAGGGAAAGISGKTGALGYASGNGLLTAIALGRLAGLTAASEIAQASV